MVSDRARSSRYSDTVMEGYRYVNYLAFPSVVYIFFRLFTLPTNMASRIMTSRVSDDVTCIMGPETPPVRNRGVLLNISSVVRSDISF